MVTPEFDEVGEGTNESNGSLPPPTYTHSLTRETIADRTGELLTAAVKVAQDMPRATIGSISDPLDGTNALVVIGEDVEPLSPSLFDAYRTNPVRVKGTARMTQVESFIAAVNRFKNEDSAIFANESRSTPSLLAVIDYHDAVFVAHVDGEDISNPQALAQHGDHKISYAFPLSDEWKGWVGANAKPMGMADFARFLEDRIVDVDSVEPDQLSAELKRFFSATGKSSIAGPSRLMALATGLKINEESVVREVRNLSSGEAQVQFTSEHRDDAGQPIDIPGMFIICIPVFQRSPAVYRIAARLRYRKTAEGILFWYELWRSDAVFDHAFAEACDKVATETGLPLFYGQPEA